MYQKKTTHHKQHKKHNVIRRGIILVLTGLMFFLIGWVIGGQYIHANISSEITIVSESRTS